jgi:hypothetical protein
MLFLCITLIFGEFMKWTSYSDRSELPMSKQARDEMRQNLLKIKRENLNASDKKKYDDFMAALNQSNTSSKTEPFITLKTLLIFMFIGALVAFYLWKGLKQTVKMFDENDRNIRLKKYS